MIKPFQQLFPRLDASARLAENATVVGDVTVEAQASIWYGAVLRADESPIRVGAGSNLQDNVVVHVGRTHPATIGRNVTVGHGAILHGCTVEDGCLIGMGAILLNGCTIGAGSLVAAGSLVTQNTVIPPGCLAMGSPARVARPLTPEEAADLVRSAQTYREMSQLTLPPAPRSKTEV